MLISLWLGGVQSILSHCIHGTSFIAFSVYSLTYILAVVGNSKGPFKVNRAKTKKYILWSRLLVGYFFVVYESFGSGGFRYYPEAYHFFLFSWAGSQKYKTGPIFPAVATPYE